MSPEPCTNCGDPRLHEVPAADGPNYRGFRGWCVRCYRRWRDNGKPADGPPPPRRSGGPGPWRVEEYQFLRSPLGGSLSRTEAAQRLGVTIRTALRYEARLAPEARTWERRHPRQVRRSQHREAIKEAAA